MNERIRAPRVRLIGPDGAQLGIVPIRQAMEVAAEHDLDLIEVAPQADPPVCRIMDYGKYKYQQSKRQRTQERKRPQQEIKGIRLRPRTDAGDFQTKVKTAERFLTKGYKVKVTCMFRGREMSHRDIGQAQLERMAEALSEIAVVEMRPSMQGRTMNMVLAPKN